MGFLGEFRPFAFISITFSIVAIAFFFIPQRGTLLLTGILLGSGIFSLVLGIAILPMTFLGLLIGIGIFGLTPFITSFVFLRNAYRAWRGSTVSSRGSVLARVTLGVLLAVGIPLVT